MNTFIFQKVFTVSPKLLRVSPKWSPKCSRKRPQETQNLSRLEHFSDRIRIPKVVIFIIKMHQHFGRQFGRHHSEHHLSEHLGDHLGDAAYESRPYWMHPNIEKISNSQICLYMFPIEGLVVIKVGGIIHEDSLGGFRF